MKLVMPPAVRLIIQELETNGYEGYAVGGCVRDACLGREPNDWDITTSASPEKVKEIFGHTVDTGIAHGTVTVLIDGEGFEVTTYRIDGKYEDARHPTEVTFTANLLEDLKRRDFTINAMAYNDSTGLVDAFGGQEDLRNKVIRCVGEPEHRFGEDALRMMRAVRFAAQLGFSIEERTRRAAVKLAGNLVKISAERIREELVKLLMSDHPDILLDAWDLSLTRVFLPEFDAMMERGSGETAVKALRVSGKDRIVRLTLLLRDINNGSASCAEAVAQLLRRLKFDRDTMKKTAVLSELSFEPVPDCKAGIRKLASRLGDEQFDRWVCVKEALLQAGYVPGREEAGSDDPARLSAVRELYAQIRKDGDCLSLSELALTGTDLTADGMKPGKQVGEVLHRLLEEVLQDPARNTRAYLLQRSRELRMQQP